MARYCGSDDAEDAYEMRLAATTDDADGYQEPLHGWTCGTCGLFYEDDGSCPGHCGHCPNSH